MKPHASTSGLLTIGFIAMGTWLLVMEVVSVMEINQLASSTEKIYQHPLTVSNAALEAQSYILRMHRDMKDIVLAHNSA